MLEQIVSSFLGSSEAGGLVKSLTGLGLTPEKATAAVSATAEGTKAAVGDAGIGGLLALATEDHRCRQEQGWRRHARWIARLNRAAQAF